jgi:hypothetical protein
VTARQSIKGAYSASTGFWPFNAMMKGLLPWRGAKKFARPRILSQQRDACDGRSSTLKDASAWQKACTGPRE